MGVRGPDPNHPEAGPAFDLESAHPPSFTLTGLAVSGELNAPCSSDYAELRGAFRDEAIDVTEKDCQDR